MVILASLRLSQQEGHVDTKKAKQLRTLFELPIFFCVPENSNYRF